MLATGVVGIEISLGQSSSPKPVGCMEGSGGIMGTATLNISSALLSPNGHKPLTCRNLSNRQGDNDVISSFLPMPAVLAAIVWDKEM